MILHIVQILSVVIFLKCNHLSIRDCFTKRKTYFKSVVVSLVIGIILMLIGGMVDGLIPINNIENEVSENSMVYMIFVCIFAGIIAPVFEEIEFRALLFQNLHASSSFIFSISCSSLMFCVIHTGGINSGTFFMGIVSCLVLTWTGNLIYSILIHFGGNLSIVLLLLGSLFCGESDTNVTEEAEVLVQATEATSSGIYQTIMEFGFVFFVVFMLTGILVYCLRIIYKQHKITNNNVKLDNIYTNSIIV